MNAMEVTFLIPELERIERDAWRDLAAIVPSGLAQEMGLYTADLHGSFLFMASRMPQFQFNWLCGAGLHKDDGPAVSTAVRRFRLEGQRKFFIQLPPGPGHDRCLMRARMEGLKPHPLSWAKFYRTTPDPPVGNSALTVRAVTVEERVVFARTVAEGFGMPPSMIEWFMRLVGRNGWSTYLSYGGDEPAGAAAMYVRGDLAWLGIGSTRPSMRKRGSQSALLARRLQDAGRLGAGHATVETGVPQPGGAATSYNNILRAGFSVAYVRPNWSEPGD